MQTNKHRIRNTRVIFRVASGNFLGMYDFAVYGCCAAFIANVFFPSGSKNCYYEKFCSLWSRIFMRPLGMIALGAYMGIDTDIKGSCVYINYNSDSRQ